MHPKEITFHGIAYTAKISQTGLCNGCDLRAFSDCSDEDRACTASDRDDGRAIIWVKKAEEMEKKYFKIVEFRGDNYGSLASEDCDGCAFHENGSMCNSSHRAVQLPCVMHANDGISVIWEKISTNTVGRPEQTTSMKYATESRKFNFPNGFTTDDETVAKFVDDNYDQLCEDYVILTSDHQSFADFVTLIMKWAAK